MTREIHSGDVVLYGGRRHVVGSIKSDGIAGPLVTLHCFHDGDDRDACDGTTGHAWTSVELLTWPDGFRVAGKDPIDPRD